MQKSGAGQFTASGAGLIVELIILFAVIPALFLSEVDRVLRAAAIAAVVLCVFSVYPQSVIFRGFFLERYATLSPNRCVLVVSPHFSQSLRIGSHRT